MNNLWHITLELFNEIYFMFVEMAPYLTIGLIFVGILHILVSKQFIVRHLGKRNLWSVIKASILGVPLPLCSCGVIPTAVFMQKSGAKRGSIVSFLISTPQTGVDSIIATYGMLGPVFAIFRPVAAFIMGILGGGFIHLLEKRKQSPKTEYEIDAVGTCHSDIALDKKPSQSKLSKLARYAFVEFLDDISVQFGIGIILAGVIAFALPDDLSVLLGSGGSNLLAMLIVILVGVPMYICATASIPIALALIMKGFSPGTAFVFLAVGPATNAATIAVLQKVLGKKSTIFYLIALVVLSVLAALSLDWIYMNFDLPSPSSMHMHGEHTLLSPLVKYIVSAIFFVLLISSYIRKIRNRYFVKGVTMGETTKFNVSGMTCNHCVANVRRAALEVEGVDGVEISLEKGEVNLEGDFDVDAVKENIRKVGYEVE